ncbi:MAG: hypothetical protein ACRDRX_04445 [Pseudonocardiaceae bacterium]
MAAYEVTGPAAVVTDQAGKVHYYYTGALLPADLSVDQVRRLTARGLISKVADPTPTDADLHAVLDASGSSGGEVERPAQVASKAVWVDYAVSRGLDRAVVEAMRSKQEIIDACLPE